MAEFRGGTVEEVAEMLGIYIRKQIAGGAPIDEAVAVVMRTPAGYVGAIGSRDGLFAQVEAMSPFVARDIRRDLKSRPGHIPIVTLDLIERTHGIQWIGPFPNALGGSA